MIEVDKTIRAPDSDTRATFKKLNSALVVCFRQGCTGPKFFQ